MTKTLLVFTYKLQAKYLLDLLLGAFQDPAAGLLPAVLLAEVPESIQ